MVRSVAISLGLALARDLEFLIKQIAQRGPHQTVRSRKVRLAEPIALAIETLDQRAERRLTGRFAANDPLHPGESRKLAVQCTEFRIFGFRDIGALIYL